MSGLAKSNQLGDDHLRFLVGHLHLEIRWIEKSPFIRQVGRMNFKSSLALLCAASLIAGCGKTPPPAGSPAVSPTPSIEDLLPKHAQPKLRTMKIYLGPETFDAELALTQQEEMIGMMFRTNIQETDAMLFVLPYTTQASFWMKNCPETISAAYINPDGVIEEIHRLEANNTNPVVAMSDNIRFVLETKEGWFQRHNIAPGMVIRTEKGSLSETFLRGR
jgi:uncharacterized protein